MKIRYITLLFFLLKSFIFIAQDCKTIGNKQNGLYIEYNPNCTKKIECFFKNGQYDSTYTEWTEDGDLKIKGLYCNGKKEGIWRHERTLIDDGYEPSVNLNYVEFTYSRGILKSAYEYVSYSDSLTPKGHEKFVTYGKDTVARVLAFTRSGKLNHEDSLVNGRIHGLQRVWNENGKVTKESYVDKSLPVKEIYYYNTFKTIILYYPKTVAKSSLKQYDLQGKLLYEEHYDKKGKVTKKKGTKQISN